MTCVMQPGYEMGKRAVEIIIARQANAAAAAQEMIFDVTLRVGISGSDAQRQP
jgi:DNA-binding LacI/PurR family transcriptional regulator